MPYKITLIPGDGIGPEITRAVVRIIEASGVEIEWEKFVAGAEALSRLGDPLPEPVLESIKENRVALKGPLTTPVGTGFSSVNVNYARRSIYTLICVRSRRCRAWSLHSAILI
jgi:isocitrate dehydrogenase (NAD+)